MDHINISDLCVGDFNPLKVYFNGLTIDDLQYICKTKHSIKEELFYLIKGKKLLFLIFYKKVLSKYIKE